MADVDIFVVYDCVQFPRRGWVHRNKLTHANGSAEWLTLPLAKGDRDNTRIFDLQWADQAQAEWEKRLKEFPILRAETPLMHDTSMLDLSPCDYLVRGLASVSSMLGFTCRFERSSPLNIAPDIHGQDRILTIASHFDATHYVNAPGGKDLYQQEAFNERGITLEFLPDYTGNYTSILERLLSEPAEAITSEIRANLN